MSDTQASVPSREQLFHALSEAAEIEHCLMCTYLYAAFSLRCDPEDGLPPKQRDAVNRWRRAILDVAVEEMAHLVAVWNILSALGSTPQLGRSNFPLDPGYLPAGIVVKLAPFNLDTLQHFIYLERPADSAEPDSAPFAPEFRFQRGADSPRLTPMSVDYATVGEFYEVLAADVTRFAEHVGERNAFCGDPALQLGSADAALPGLEKVVCLKTVLKAFAAIVTQGEGASKSEARSHYQRFVAIRTELQALLAEDPDFAPAFPTAVNPVLRRPPRPQGRVWIEDPRAVATCDLASSVYGLMLRLLAYSYAVPASDPDKALALDLSVGLMHALVPLAERAARLPAGDSNPHCNAGISFTALRNASAPLPGASAHRFFVERLTQLAQAAAQLGEPSDRRSHAAATILASLLRKAGSMNQPSSPAAVPTASPPMPPTPPAATPVPAASPAVEEIESPSLTLVYEGKRCIHARHCVTWGPNVFLANVQGPWIHPEAMDVEGLVEIAHLCPSGAIRYRRKDGRPDESAPPVNLLAVREAGPYALRAELRINGEAAGFRATLCRCGASKNKPFCDGSHHEVEFEATGEPKTGTQTDMLAVRDGPLQVEPQVNGPLDITGNLEITSGTGRMVARTTRVRLCRCGASGNKPFCDGSHARIGFVAD